MDRFTNGELLALCAAIEAYWASASDAALSKHRDYLRTARDKLEAQRKAQQ
jgi:hypothetical protein